MRWDIVRRITAAGGPDPAPSAAEQARIEMTSRDPEVLAAADYQALIRASLASLFPEVTDRRERRKLALERQGAGGQARIPCLERRRQALGRDAPPVHLAGER